MLLQKLLAEPLSLAVGHVVLKFKPLYIPRDPSTFSEGTTGPSQPTFLSVSNHLLRRYLDPLYIVKSQIVLYISQMRIHTHTLRTYLNRLVSFLGVSSLGLTCNAHLTKVKHRHLYTAAWDLRCGRTESRTPMRAAEPRMPCTRQASSDPRSEDQWFVLQKA